MTDSDTEVRFCGRKARYFQPVEHLLCGDRQNDCRGGKRNFAGAGYGTFKTAVGEAVVAELEPVQKRVKELEANKDYLDAIIKSGAEKAQAVWRTEH